RDGGGSAAECQPWHGFAAAWLFHRTSACVPNPVARYGVDDFVSGKTSTGLPSFVPASFRPLQLSVLVLRLSLSTHAGRIRSSLSSRCGSSASPAGNARAAASATTSY